MERSVRRDIARRYRDVSERYSSERSECHTYQCQCGRVIRTRQLVDGIVPMGIECDVCHGDAYAVEDRHDLPVTHEWYRPSLDELVGMAEKHLFTVNCVLGGGLLRRVCSES